MAIAYFPSSDDADIIEVAFATTTGVDLNYRLLVDSGFSGSISLVLSQDIQELATIPAPASHAYGAIQGVQKRVIVFCRMPAISFQTTAVAIVSDLSPMSLPSGVQGIAGLRLLRQFLRWGAEQTGDGSWRFFLENEAT